MVRSKKSSLIFFELENIGFETSEFDLSEDENLGFSRMKLKCTFVIVRVHLSPKIFVSMSIYKGSNNFIVSKRAHGQEELYPVTTESFYFPL